VAGPLKRARWTTEGVTRRLQSLDLDDIVERPWSEHSRIWSYVDAAAVLSSFDPAALRPLDDDVSMIGPLRQLLEHSVTTFDANGGVRWRLDALTRRQALERLGSRDAIAYACSRNRPAADDDPLEQTMMGILTGEAKPLTVQSRDELTQTLEVSELLRGIVDGTPDPDEVKTALDRAAVLEPLRALVGTHFRGREKELQELIHYVGVLPPGSTLESLRRSARAALGRQTRPPLLVLGLGGIGKSTLLAKFILDHVEHAGTRTLAFAYLDFDRPGLRGGEPGSVILEAMRQLSVQCGEGDRRRWDALRVRWTERLADEQRLPGVARGRLTPGAHRASEGTMVEEFAEQYATSFGEDVPFLLVLDTFEEVQYRSSEVVDALWSFVDRLRRHVPMLRTVLAGRAPIEGRKTEELQLSTLDEEAALGFLEAQGITDVAAAKTVVSRLGGNPLTLSLAADVLRREDDGAGVIRDLTRRRRRLVFAIDQEAAQVALYRRILRHIDDDDVRKIAHPGLAVRRITSDVIRHVLADPCKLTVGSREEANRLLEGLRTEITLVYASEDGALEHRPDVRRAMLPMLRATEPAAVAAIHRSAIAYYERRDGVIDRAEEIYHRLASGEDPALVDERWRGGIEDRLRASVPELPARAQAYLAGRVGVEIDLDAWRAASRDDRERLIEQRARNQLRLARPNEALAILETVTDRSPGSSLYLLEAIAHRQLGYLVQAKGAIDAALDSDPDRPAALELFALGAEIAVELGELEAAAELIDDACEVARMAEDEPRMLELGVLRMRIWRARGRSQEKHLRVVAAEVHRDLATLEPTLLVAQSALAQGMAGELGGAYPSEIVRVAAIVGLPELRPKRVQRILIQWNHELRGRLAEDPDISWRALVAAPTFSSAEGMELVLELLARHRLTPGAGRALASEIRNILRATGEAEQA
jgi:tetratricopeptide (TPR) repeat protein